MEKEEETESTKALSLSSMIIKEVMEWDTRSNPDPHLVDKLIRCKKEDMYDMYSQSQNVSGIETKFRLLAENLMIPN